MLADTSASISFFPEIEPSAQEIDATRMRGRASVRASDPASSNFVLESEGGAIDRSGRD